MRYQRYHLPESRCQRTQRDSTKPDFLQDLAVDLLVEDPDILEDRLVDPQVGLPEDRLADLPEDPLADLPEDPLVDLPEDLPA